MQEEILLESELATRLGTSVDQVRKWAKAGKFNKNVRLYFHGDLVDVKYFVSDTVNSRRKVDQILDEMENSRLKLA